MNWKDILVRAAKTFLQTALATFTVVPQVTDVEAWGVAGLVALNAGVAAVFSMLQNVVTDKVTS